MQYLVDTYKCEWKEVVNDPETRRLFRQFVNTDETEDVIELVGERGQQRPANWPKNLVPVDSITLPNGNKVADSRQDRGKPKRWVQVGKVWDFPVDGGAAIKYGKTQIAVFNFQSRGEWYATQNMCPHMNAFVLSRGIVGDSSGIPKVACPLHKKTFDLSSGRCTGSDPYELATFPVRVEGDDVFLQLPPIAELDEKLATESHRVGVACSADTT